MSEPCNGVFIVKIIFIDAEELAAWEVPVTVRKATERAMQGLGLVATSKKLKSPLFSVTVLFYLIGSDF